MTQSGSIILLYCLATLIAIVARRLRVPSTAALLVAGVVLGAVHVVPLPHLTKDLLFTVFLPGLIFEAAYGLGISELRASAATIGVLAVPGVVLTIAITAGLLMAASHALPVLGHIGWAAALMVGTVVAATDPVAVTSLLREMNAPRRLRVLLEGESLLNDGTSIVAFTLLLAYLAGTSTTTLSLVVGFLRMTLGGAVVGVAIGWGVSHVRRRGARGASARGDHSGHYGAASGARAWCMADRADVERTARSAVAGPRAGTPRWISRSRDDHLDDGRRGRHLAHRAGRVHAMAASAPRRRG